MVRVANEINSIWCEKMFLNSGQYLFYLSCTLLGPHSLGMTMFDLLFLYLVGPYLWNVGDVWFNFLLCVLVLCMIYIYVCLFKDGHALCMMDSHD